MASFDQLVAQVTFGDLFPMFTRIGATVIVAILVNSIFSRLVKWVLESRNMDRRMVRQIGLVSRYLVFLAAFMFVLNYLGVTPDILLTSLGIVGIAAGFAAQDLLSNLLNGIFLIFENTIKVSDVVKVGDVYGVVRLIKLRSTEIRTFDNNIVSIPNSKLAQSNIINLTSGSKYSMATINVKLNYLADFEKAKEIMREVVNKTEGAIVDSVHGVRFEVFNMEERYHGLNVTVYFFVEAIREPWIKSDALQKIIERFIESKMPFHRDSPK